MTNLSHPWRIKKAANKVEHILKHTWLLVPYIAIVVSLILFFQLKGR